MGSLTFKFLVGGLAGVLAWMIIEPTNPGLRDPNAWSSFELRLILALGALVGLGVGALDGYTRGSRTHFIRGALLGVFFGAVGATFGYSVGGTISTMIFGGVRQGMGPLTVLTRVVALTPLGICLGAAIGASSLNVKRTVQGAIGGGIGAALGAGVFDILGRIFALFTLSVNGIANGATGEVGSIPRAVFCTLMGAGIGLFIGLVERFARQAWLRLHLGRNEGKEWSIDSAQTFIGRSENVNVPLFGDPNVFPLHATIQRHGRDYVLVDGGSPLGTYLNGQRIQSAALFPGAQIQIGNFRLEFLMKESRSQAAARPVYPNNPQYPGYPHGGAPGPHGPMPGAPMPGGPMPQGPMPQSPMGAAPAPGYPMAPTQVMHPQPMPSQPMAPTQAMPGAMSMPTMAYPQAAPAAGGLALTALDGPLAGQRFPIGGPVDLGRESAAVPMAYDSQASRRHANVAPGMGALTVTDLGSTNGTYVNGQRVQSAQARPGDLLKVGGTTFRVDA